MAAHPKFSIPLQEHQNPAEYKGDDVCTVNYRPKSEFNKPAYPKYSFGYSQEMNYSTAVPAPNTYRIQRNKSDKKDFNKYNNR